MCYYLSGDYMKKMIIIDEENNNKLQRKKIFNNAIIEWLLYMVGYAIVLITTSVFFDSLEINNAYFGLYALFAAIIIYVLNQTIKPLLFYLTLPLTALTFGIFYPVINVIVLYITSFILGNNFNINNIFIAFFISLFISILNVFMEGLIIKPMIIRRKIRG